MNENQLTIVNEYEFIEPLNHKIDILIDNCIRDCHKIYFHVLSINVYIIFNIQIMVMMR